MILHPREKGISRSVKQLDWRRAPTKGPVANQAIDCVFVVGNTMRPLHLVVGEEMAHAVSAIERTANNMIEAQA
jgi:hypothetical protein